jgi:RHS repeat-associated protein
MHRSENQAPGVIHQHFFFGATETLPVAAGDKLVSYVYLNPANPPTQIMLQWFATDGSGWEHRAYWGANQIPWGTDGTESRRYQGPLPATGQWVRLEVDAASVGLSGRSISGMAYSQVGGQADWDHSGKVSATGVETLYVDDTLPAGATPYGTWTWGDTGLSTPAAFTGHHYHPRSTLHLAPYRAYSADLGRWLSRDPIESVSGEMAEFLPEGPNLYAYASNNSSLYADTSGLAIQWTVPAAVLLLLGAAWAVCCAAHMGEIATRANEIVNGITANTGSNGYWGGNEGSPADALQHCIGACMANQNPGACLSSAFVRTGINQSDKNEPNDLNNNDVGFGISGDCQSGCLTALREGRLTCGGTSPSVPAFPCAPPQ